MQRYKINNFLLSAIFTIMPFDLILFIIYTNVSKKYSKLLYYWGRKYTSIDKIIIIRLPIKYKKISDLYYWIINLWY